MKFFKFIKTSFYEEYHRWPLWIPVFIGIGVVIYFSLSYEPSLWWGIGSIIATSSLYLFYCHSMLRYFFLVPVCIALGFGAAELRTYTMDVTMIHYPIGPLEIKGYVETVEQKETKSLKITQRILLNDVQAKTNHTLPKKIRLTLRGTGTLLKPGQFIVVKAKLLPLNDPVSPWSYDFRRHGYFKGIGATGFGLSPPQVLKEVTQLSWKTWIESLRENLTYTFRHSIDSPEGAIAAALVTGDRSGIPKSIRESFISSGLAHILAISGLHLSIVAGLIFLVMRRGIALIPPLNLRLTSKKYAAFFSILITFAYLLISGSGIPAQRAFIMTAVVMIAIMIDREALSLRTVALAASLILLITPEVLVSPSFQLSFAAVIALIAGFETWKVPLACWVARNGLWRRVVIYLGGIIFTSLIATLATLPFTIFTFNRFSVHAIISNLLAVPLTAIVVMPLALLSCLSIALGLQDYIFPIFQYALSLLISIAESISSWPGANIIIAKPSLLSFALVILGGLWLCIWQKLWRRWGLVPLGVGCLSSFINTSPDIFVDGQGKVIGVLTERGNLAVNSLRKGKFTTESWQKLVGATELEKMNCDQGCCIFTLKGKRIVLLEKGAPQNCEQADVVISFDPLRGACRYAQLRIDWFDIWKSGGYVLWFEGSQQTIQSIREVQGDRPWTRQAIPRKHRPSDIEI